MSFSSTMKGGLSRSLSRHEPAHLPVQAAVCGAGGGGDEAADGAAEAEAADAALGCAGPAAVGGAAVSLEAAQAAGGGVLDDVLDRYRGDGAHHSGGGVFVAWAGAGVCAGGWVFEHGGNDPVVQGTARAALP
ncbi:MAG: hypothetical protein E6Q40_09635 [Cupriavidus sp.]|nr:MAG: hypothetical protein E6Q40_09635 [Cupriavidus sp.]